MGWQWPQGPLLRGSTPSSLDVGGGLGAGALVGFSTLDIGNGALSEEVEAIGPFLAPSNISISMLKRLPSSTTGTRHLQSSCTALQNSFGEALAWIAHHWSTIAIASVSSLCTSQ